MQAGCNAESAALTHLTIYLRVLYAHKKRYLLFILLAVVPLLVGVSPDNRAPC